MTPADRRGTAAPPMGVTSAVARAYSGLRAQILDGTLPPHAQYLKSDLAKSLGVSRTPIREACIRLQAEGLVEIVPRRGIRIVPISARDMVELYDLLATLESRAAELAAEIDLDESVLALLYEAVDRMDQGVQDDDLEGWAEADSDFHRRLSEAPGNRHLAETIASYADRVQRARLATLRLRAQPTTSNRSHRELIDAIAAGESTRAHDLHLNHRRETATAIMSLLVRHGLTSL